ncbi:hypothetical protein PF005_g15787 [Phytophthora fragariae]|nr:hypothetical protein PF003_g22706 [Phytophthora fragariae]KAE8933171.1 hypothetical protein PF009_g16821 [Phytophthora fragariae]KAE8999110.1 hypothetical protein PF011_g14762 [Phytophthora fragariae]KAE9099572.1 hypothetical protein PF007_g15829 [Phytophthora fragariae]KAE9114351.1 hypothetical protein PF010_g9735 [Phytophthora fragariae]
MTAGLLVTSSLVVSATQAEASSPSGCKDPLAYAMRFAADATTGHERHQRNRLQVVDVVKAA